MAGGQGGPGAHTGGEDGGAAVGDPPRLRLPLPGAAPQLLPPAALPPVLPRHRRLLGTAAHARISPVNFENRDAFRFSDGVARSALLFPQKAVILWTMDPAERDANLVHGALRRRGDGDHLAVLVEVACASDPDHLVAVRRAYRSLFGCSVEEDLASCAALQQPLRKMLVSLVSSYRYGGDRVDADVARLEASQLSEAVRKKQPHHDEVVRILSTRSKPQLRATLRRYREDHGTDIVEDIDSRCSSQFARTLRSAVWCLTSPEKHFAEMIRESVVGLGTYEDMLTRVVVSRAEIDMKQIKEEYRARFKTTVTCDVVDDTSFGYKDILLALVGCEEE
ncbi:unnamed protein product [Triticum turgidum subsp. durum]|uniref:Annexin n=1 Tax=Triticum turgidum subsp. durum TaxID=4567 RepID=A0A9R1NLB8_TRITD|nr:unnamed protein product [Triticum turgidum subsp. durum]